MWPALRAGIGLSVETAVVRIIILLLTGRTHGEGGHGGFYPIIGDILDDGETGTTVGAIDEGVEVASVFRVHEFPQTILTRGDIR